MKKDAQYRHKTYSKRTRVTYISNGQNWNASRPPPSCHHTVCAGLPEPTRSLLFSHRLEWGTPPPNTTEVLLNKAICSLILTVGYLPAGVLRPVSLSRKETDGGSY